MGPPGLEPGTNTLWESWDNLNKCCNSLFITISIFLLHNLGYSNKIELREKKCTLKVLDNNCEINKKCLERQSPNQKKLK